MGGSQPPILLASSVFCFAKSNSLIDGAFTFLTAKKNSGCEITATFLLSLLAFADSIYGTTVCTCAAIDAAVSVDDVLAVTLGDGGHGAALGASAASDASIGNLVSHGSYLLHNCAFLRFTDIIPPDGSEIKCFVAICCFCYVFSHIFRDARAYSGLLPEASAMAFASASFQLKAGFAGAAGLGVSAAGCLFSTCAGACAAGTSGAPA